MGDILLSQKHGVNPTIPICFLCSKPKNEILLLGCLKGDIEAPKNTCFDNEPCDQCKKYQKQGIIVIGIRDGESGENPHRTGGFWVVKKQAIKKLLQHDSKLLAKVIKYRAIFIENEVCKIMGLLQFGSFDRTSHN